MKRTTALAIIGGWMLSMHAACGDDGDTSGTSSSSSGSGSGSTGSSSQTCSQCLQDAALAIACKDKTMTCLQDDGSGGAGGAMACGSCQDWALTCQTKSLEECAAAQSSLCPASLPLATALQDCTCTTCKDLCGAQCM